MSSCIMSLGTCLRTHTDTHQPALLAFVFLTHVDTETRAATKFALAFFFVMLAEASAPALLRIVK